MLLVWWSGVLEFPFQTDTCFCRYEAAIDHSYHIKGSSFSSNGHGIKLSDCGVPLFGLTLASQDLQDFGS